MSDNRFEFGVWGGAKAGDIWSRPLKGGNPGEGLLHRLGDKGLPFGLQVTGCFRGDAELLNAQAFQEARGILMVATFNEGEEVGSKTKQWVITPRDRLPIAIAVICEQWTNGTEVLDTFVMATTPPNALIARITDRMPAILPREAWATWLGETQASLAEVKELLRTYEDGGNWTMEPQTSTRPARHPTSQSRRHRENCSRREAKKQRPRSRLSQILSPHSD